MLKFKEIEFDINNDPRGDWEHTVAEFVDRIIKLSAEGELKAISNNRIQVKTKLSTYIFYPLLYK